jgi:hypothetical protein
MKTKEIQVHKHYKLGLPHYSSMDVGIGMTIELEENEKPNWHIIWEEINREIQKEAGDLDPLWIKGIQEKATKEFTKTK